MIKYLNKFLIVIIFLLGIGFSNCYAAIVTDSSGDLVLDSSNDPVSDTNGSPPVMPSITTQPVNQTVLAPAMGTFTVVASGNPTPTYQWQQEAPGATSYTTIIAATSTSYATPATTTANSGTRYECVVTNVLGSVTSNAVTLTVNSVPSITTQPVSETVTAPATAVFTVTASGNPAPAYQWQQEAPGSSSFTAISGATSASYTTSATTTANNGTKYECVLTNSAGTATTNAVTLTVNPLPVVPTITTQPASTTVTAPATAIFSVVATGTPTPTYQWQSEASGATSYTAISGATSASYTTSATVTANNGTKYECVVTNSVGSVTSNAATLTVNSSGLPGITTQPSNATVTAPATATFTIVATGTPTPTYQWMQEVSGATSYTAISGATSASYTTPATTTANSGIKYECVVTNSAGSVTSTAATLTINPGLVGWWKFTDGSGSSAADSSGSGDTGTLVNSPSWVAGEAWPYALSFNGTNQYVVTAKATNIPNMNGNTTYSAWVNESAAPGAPRDIVVGELSGTSANQLRINASGNAEVSQWGGGITITAGAVSIKAWHMITWTYDGTTNSIYIDGVLSKTSTTAHQTGTPGAVFIGAYGTASNNENFNGSIDDVRIYNGALSASTVAQLYASTKPAAPGITTQPSNATVTAPATATFTIVATGVPTPTYQWMQEASGATSYTAISAAGATSASYTTPATTTANSGIKYECVVTNSVGSVTSNAVTLTVKEAAPIVNLTANNSTFTSPANITLNATASQAAGTISSVSFYNGTTLLGTITTSPYTYNWNNVAAGNYSLTAQAYNNGGGMTVSNTLSITVTAPNTYIKSTNYNANGQITQIQYGNGTTTAYTYNPLNFRLMRIYTSNAQAVVVQDLNYIYDSVGQILSITDNVNTGTSSMTQSFTYDPLNRLVSATGAYGAKNYAYDSIGNITQKDGLTYNYGEANSRTNGTAAGPHAVTSLSDGSVFKYDANGNMVSLQKASNLTQYAYDSQNRLQTVTVGGLIAASYVYDGDGGRTQKTVNRRDLALYNDNTNILLFGSTSNPLPATAQNPVVDTTIYAGNVYESENATGLSRNTKFVYLGNTRVAAEGSDGSLFYYHTDHLGTTNVLTDNTGLVRELTVYDPFGQVITHEKYGNNFATAWYYFTGKPLDDETGLIFLGARYYNPVLGRFITPDTEIQAPNNPQTFNRYTYCNNNPVNLIDPSGHSWWSNFWKSFIGAIIGAIITVVTAGAGTPFWIAGMLGGAIGGAITGGLEGGLQGALMGGLIGGILGGIGGWAYGAGNGFVMGALFAGGIGYTAATGDWANFAGGLVGSLVGTGIGNGINSVEKSFQQSNNQTQEDSEKQAEQKIDGDLKSGKITEQDLVKGINSNQATPDQIDTLVKAIVGVINQQRDLAQNTFWEGAGQFGKGALETGIIIGSDVGSDGLGLFVSFKNALGAATDLYQGVLNMKLGLQGGYLSPRSFDETFEDVVENSVPDENLTKPKID